MSLPNKYIIRGKLQPLQVSDIPGKFHTYLIDTGADGGIITENMRKLNNNPGKIEAGVLTHAYWNHANGPGMKRLNSLAPITATIPSRSG